MKIDISLTPLNTIIKMLLFVSLLQYYEQKETQEWDTERNTLGLSAGGPLSRTEAATSGFKSRPKESGGWLLYFGASFSTDHCDETSKQSALRYRAPD